MARTPYHEDRGFDHDRSCIIYVKQTSTASKKYEIVETNWAVIDHVLLRINDPLNSWISSLGSHEFFEANFDQVFYSNLNGLIHTSILDFGFKPSILIGYQMWYDYCIPDCTNFREFITHLSMSKLLSFKKTTEN